jgi:hydrogenase expression/formation protein HypC
LRILIFGFRIFHFSDLIMCLAIPMKVLELDGQRGVVEMSGARRNIVLAMTPEAKVGDYVIVHAGYALEVMNEEEAMRTLELIRQLGEAGE